MLIFPENEHEQIEFVHDIILDHFKGSKELARDWFETENYYLRGETPIKSKRSGNMEEVFEAVKKLVGEK